MDPEVYKNETKAYFYIIEKIYNPILFNEVVNFVQSKDSATKIQIAENQFIDYIPSKNIYIKMDTQNIGSEFKDSIISMDSAMFIQLSKNYMLVSEFCMIDILSTNKFERPVYFASSVYSGSYECIESYLSFEGMVYKVGPVKNDVPENNGKGIIYPDILYDKLVNKLKFDTKNYKSINTSKQNILNTYYIIFTRLTDSYLNAGKPEKAIEVMDYFCQNFSPEVVRYNYYMYPLISNYFKAGKTEKGIELLKICVNSCKMDIESLINTTNQEGNAGKLAIAIFSLKELLNISDTYIPNDTIINELSQLIERYEMN
jgi:hypothetical protein